MSRWYRWFALAARPTQSRRQRRARSFRAATIRRIWVHKPDHLGDVLLARPALAALRAAFPAAEITVACRPEAAPLLAGDALRLHTYDWPSPFLGGDGSFRAYHRAVRRLQPDLLLNLRQDVHDILWCTLQGAPYYAGYDHRGSAAFATHPGGPPREDRPETENHLALLRESLGIEPVEPPPLFLPDAALEKARAAWAAWPGGRRVVLHAAARTAAKMWPAAHWRRLAELLASDGQTRPVLIGAPEDRELGEQISRAPSPVIDWTGRFSLLETAGLLGRADLLIGIDSAPGHLAATLGVKVVSIMSGTNSAVRWAPRGAVVLTHSVECAPCRRESCPVGGHPCLAELSPETVYQAARESLGG